jgi:hypothetical protein
LPPTNLVHFQVRHKRPPFGVVPLRRILLTMFDAIYVDTVEEKRIVAIRPGPAFRPLFEVVTTREDSSIVLVNEKDLENAN